MRSFSKSDFDQYESAAKLAAANLLATQSAQLLIRRASVQQQIANLKSAEARRDQALPNLDYTKIKAPVARILMRRSAQLGNRVQAGQQRLSISEIGDL